MEKREIAHVVAAILLMFVVYAVIFVLEGEMERIAQVLIFSVVVVGIPLIVKNAAAYSLDAGLTHEIWSVYRFGVRPKQHFNKPRPFGLVVPLIFSLISLGAWKVTTLLTYETRALKHRAAKRFGFYSYTEMTDWHNGLIGAAGVVSLLVISVLAYLSGVELLAAMATHYAFWNMVPISKLDGAQVFFGNRVLWVVLEVTTLIFVLYSLVL